MFARASIFVALLSLALYLPGWWIYDAGESAQAPGSVYMGLWRYCERMEGDLLCGDIDETICEQHIIEADTDIGKACKGITWMRFIAISSVVVASSLAAYFQYFQNGEKREHMVRSATLLSGLLASFSVWTAYSVSVHLEEQISPGPSCILAGIAAVVMFAPRCR